MPQDVAVLLLIALAAAGLVLLTFGADHLVLGAGRLAGRLRISAVVVGVVVIGVGTSAPEFVVSGFAVARGEGDLALGNLIGSNIFNVTLILGIAALIKPVLTHSSVVRREAPISVVATMLFSAAIVFGLGLVAGAALAAVAVVALVVLVWLSYRTTERALPVEVAEFLDGAPIHKIPREVVRTLLGLAATLGGAQLVVINAAEIATRLGVPHVVVGFTVVAIGTSLPELVTAVQAQRRGEAELLVGNLLGSNLFNSLIGGAIIGLTTGSAEQARVGNGLLAAMVFVALLSWALLFRGNRVTRRDAGVLLVAYLLTLPLVA